MDSPNTHELSSEIKREEAAKLRETAEPEAVKLREESAEPEAAEEPMDVDSEPEQTTVPANSFIGAEPNIWSTTHNGEEEESEYEEDISTGEYNVNVEDSDSDSETSDLTKFQEEYGESPPDGYRFK